MLHIVNKSPFKYRNLDTCVRVSEKGDPIILIEDGVYAALCGSSIEGLMKKTLQNHPVFAMQADLKARGIDKVLDGVQVCDYGCFVDMVEKHVPYSWL